MLFFDGPAQEAETATNNYAFLLILEGFLHSVLALIFAFFLLAWHASGEAANIEKSWKTLFFCGSQAIRAFFTHTAKDKKFKAAAARK